MLFAINFGLQGGELFHAKRQTDIDRYEKVKSSFSEIFANASKKILSSRKEKMINNNILYMD